VTEGSCSAPRAWLVDDRKFLLGSVCGLVDDRKFSLGSARELLGDRQGASIPSCLRPTEPTCAKREHPVLPKQPTRAKREHPVRKFELSRNGFGSFRDRYQCHATSDTGFVVDSSNAWASGTMSSANTR
jgi:hypothetical protein